MARSDTTPSFVLTLPLKYTISDKAALDKYFEIARRYYNAILNKLLKRYYLMVQSKKYRHICKMAKSKERNKLFKKIEEEYGLSGTAINKLITSLRVNEYKELGSHVTIKLELRAMQAIEKLKFGEADKVNFIKYGEMYSFESSDNRQGIKFRDGIVIFNKLKIPVIVKKNDIYAQMALKNRVKYCRFIKKNIKGKDRYYVQLILEGIPPLKINKETGEIKNYIGNGKVGIDIGTQTIAICSDNEVKLLELAPEINNIEKEKRRLQRKLDRSRRATNPNKYNEDGTINTKDKSKWIKSKNYIKTQIQLREIQRKQAIIREESHNKLANYIISLGNDIKVETMNYKGLQARAKETTINEKTGRFNKKKRFGKSLANKAPAKLIEILSRKLKYYGEELKKINTRKVKASQYNHLIGKYKNKNLNERWNDFGEYKIQRDLYSAFIISNVNDDLESIDRERCIVTFERFKNLHDIEIQRLMNMELTQALKNVI